MFCPRIVYYIELSSLQPQYPMWVKQGADFHTLQSDLWKRRNLSRFSLDKGKVELSLSLKSDRHRLHGEVDMAIFGDSEVYPVEFKLSESKISKGAIYQLTAYSLMLTEKYRMESPFGFLLEGKKGMRKIIFSKKYIDAVLHIVGQIEAMISSGIKPDSSAHSNKCINCEYINHCNDR